jgi:hypothetical protein
VNKSSQRQRRATDHCLMAGDRRLGRAAVRRESGSGLTLNFSSPTRCVSNAAFPAHGHQNPHLRRGLQHTSVVANGRISSAISPVPMALNPAAVSPGTILLRPWEHRRTPAAHAQLVAPPEPDASNSANAGMALTQGF